MRKFVALLVSLSLAGCGGGDGLDGPDGPAQCTNDNQKQYVLDSLYYWYLWNDSLPAGINIADYPSPEVLVQAVTETYGPQRPGGGPLDRFSYVGSAEADQQFFGEGRYEGFGFSWRLEGPDMRFTRVFVSSPAFAAGFSRGQTVLGLDGRTIADINASEGIDAVLDADTVEFEIQNPDLTTFTVSVTKDIVTINPIPQYRTIAMGAGEPPVGYMEFATFISTAHDGLDGNDFNDVFADFIAAGAEDVIIDLRYNGGGLVDTAKLLADHLGGFNNDGQIFTNTEFNADRAASNNAIDYLSNRANAIDLNRLIIIASRGTASASELVINGLDPFVTGGVYIVGDSTYGKPVGQIGLQFCEKILRPTTFRTSNAAGVGDYFDGLPVDCAVADDLSFPVGDASDPNMIAALSYIEGAGCPVVSLPGGQQKADRLLDSRQPDLRGPPEREFAGAF
jgi:C-terminal processing protease CtpA/Prc